MTFASAPARWLGSLAFCFLSCVGAQTLPSAPEPQTLEDLLAQQPAEQLLPPEQLPATPLRFERAWDVVELMGQPMLSDAQRPARVLIRPQGGLWVDGGCNYFSGRIERDGQGLFRVSKYGGTHSACEKLPRSEVILNSALVMVDNYRWDRGLVLRSGGNDLVRLLPSANQDSQDIEQGLASRAAPALAGAPVHAAAEQDCRTVKVKVAPHRKHGSRHAKAAATRQICKPAHPGARPTGKSSASKPAGKPKATGKAKSSGKARPASSAKLVATRGKHER